MRRVFYPLIFALLAILMASSAINVNAIPESQFTVVFTTEKIVSVDPDISKDYIIGQISGNTTLSWQGNGSGYAYLYLNGQYLKTLILSASGQDSLGVISGNMTIQLDSACIWEGTITITIEDPFTVSVVFNPSSVSLEPGQSARVTMRINRVSGDPRYISIQHTAPSGITMQLEGYNYAYLQDYVEFPITISASSDISPGTYYATIRVYVAESTDGGGGGGGGIIPPWGPVITSAEYEGWELAGETTLSVPIGEVSGEEIPIIGGIYESAQTYALYAIIAILALLILVIIYIKR